MKDLFVCSPEHFYAQETQRYIRSRCNDSDKRWIYSLIASSGVGVSEDRERIFINTDQWMLCRDKHPGRDVRYLVVFKDLLLTTIRALDQSHLAMLADVELQVRSFLKETHGAAEAAEFKLFFHYMPSVYQLHAHVSTHVMPPHVVRRHYFHHVIRNIKKYSQHYHDALILTTSVRKARTTPPRVADVSESGAQVRHGGTRVTDAGARHSSRE